MSVILQMTRKLCEPPQLECLDEVGLRHFQGPADIEVWLDLRRRAFAREKVGVGDWDAADFSREFLEKSWWRPEAMWFAEVRGLPPPDRQVVGTITLAYRGEPPADKPVVHWLAVLPSYRRRGVGRLLVATLEAAAWDAGRRQVWLETHSGWTRAVRLYASLGYVPAEESMV
jgi:GNAT superfamily N-acetyltransferase